MAYTHHCGSVALGFVETDCLICLASDVVYRASVYLGLSGWRLISHAD